MQDNEERPCKREKPETEPPSHTDLVLLENTLNTLKMLNHKALKERSDAHFYCTVDNERAVQQYENAQSKLREMHDVITAYLRLSGGKK